MMTRRQALKTTALVATASAVVPAAFAQPAAATPFTLPPLPYAFDALEPHIDARTMEIHHDRHHKAYVDNLNKASSEHLSLATRTLENLLANLQSVPEKIRTAVRNNAGGHYNHSLFWQMMKKDGGGEPKGELAKAIETSFSNFSDFKTKFSDAALKVFGSGWVWLALDGSQLVIESSPNQDSPRMGGPTAKEVEEFKKRYALGGDSPAGTSLGKQPLLGLDVWEHAYYLKYQNKRADYITAWWNVVNWDFVAERYAKLKG